MGEEESGEIKSQSEDLKDKGVKDLGRRRFLGLLGRTAKGLGAAAAVGVLGGAFYESMQPRNVQGNPSVESHELKLGEVISSREIISGGESSFIDPVTEVITDKSRFDEVIASIAAKNLNKATELSAKTFDPKTQVALLYALGEKQGAYGEYTAAIKDAKLGSDANGKHQIEIDLEYSVPFASPDGHIQTVPPPPANVTIEDPNNNRISSPFDFRVIPKVVDRTGKPLPIIFNDPVPQVATAAKF
ncbi:MAG TPA: hypothetical protein VHE53_02555 [Patescibacteria group bacterium]|nr:hypothetical protein [Patescibacteria group bacterium]